MILRDDVFFNFKETDKKYEIMSKDKRKPVLSIDKEQHAGEWQLTLVRFIQILKI